MGWEHKSLQAHQLRLSSGGSNLHYSTQKSTGRAKPWMSHTGDETLLCSRLQDVAHAAKSEPIFLSPQQSRSVYRGPGSGMLASSPRQTIPDAIELSPLPSPAVKRLVRTCPNSFPTFATHAAVWWAAPASFLLTCTVYYSYVCYDTCVHCSYIYRYLLISLPTNSSSMSPSSSAASLWRNK